MFYLGGQLFPQDMRAFNSRYRVNSMLHVPGEYSQEKLDEMNTSGKILLPQSALDWLTRLHITYPMLFRVKNPDPARKRQTHCGVYEFHQEEGRCYVPYWMMQHLLLNEDDFIQVEYVTLPTASYVKFKPQSADFLDISNHRAVLELKLRGYACLSLSDVIAIEYNNKIYELLVQDLKPAEAVSIIECDMNVEFDAPVGYKEPEKPSAKAVADTAKKMEEDTVEAPTGFTPFSGQGMRLDGKTKKSSTSIAPKPAEPSQPAEQKPRIRGIPNYEYQPGTLHFIKFVKRTPVDSLKKEIDKFTPFFGEGAKLRPRK